MSTYAPRLPASEVLRFAGAVTLRLVIALACGLVAAKAGKLGLGWTTDGAVSVGYATTGILFGLSFFLKPVPWPAVDFGPEPELSPEDSGAA